MIHVREVTLDDLPVVAEMMHFALDPYYGGDHRAHAKRIVETASNGADDQKEKWGQKMEKMETVEKMGTGTIFFGKVLSNLYSFPLKIHHSFVVNL